MSNLDEKFVKFADNLAAEVNERQAARRDVRYNTPMTNAQGHLKRRLYATGRRKIAAGKQGDFKKMAIHYRQSAEGTAEENAFEWYLLAYYASQGALTKKLRTKIRSLSLELFYAHENNVPEEQLIGFLYQLGGASKIAKLLRASHPNMFKAKAVPRQHQWHRFEVVI